MFGVIRSNEFLWIRRDIFRMALIQRPVVETKGGIRKVLKEGLSVFYLGNSSSVSAGCLPNMFYFVGEERVFCVLL
jgi:hypothetical protein